MSETDIEEIKKRINSLAPQIKMMESVFKPMEAMLTEFMKKIGVDVKIGKIVYLRDRGKLIYGIEFSGNRDVLDKMVISIGGNVVVGGEEEEVKGGEG